MKAWKTIQEELSYYKELAGEIVNDYKENKVKERIAEQERVTTESLKTEQSRQAYLSELITQANQNVILIKAKLKTIEGSLNRLPKRGFKDKRLELTRMTVWLETKLKEEEYYAQYYTEQK